MKVIWEPGDVQNGRRLRRPGSDEVWMLGYRSTNSGRRHVLISLIDGCVTNEFDTKELMAACLNQSGLQPIELIGERD